MSDCMWPHCNMGGPCEREQTCEREEAGERSPRGMTTEAQKPEANPGDVEAAEKYDQRPHVRHGFLAGCARVRAEMQAEANGLRKALEVYAVKYGKEAIAHDDLQAKIASLEKALSEREEKLRIVKEAIEAIASKHNPRHETE